MAQNGGVPQSAAFNMSLHLDQLRADVIRWIPDANFSGLALVDKEDWEPLFCANFVSGGSRFYNIYSEELIRKTHPRYNTSQLQAAAALAFDTAAKDFYLQSLAAARQLRPQAKWGYFAQPSEIDRGASAEHVQSVRAINARLGWLYAAVDFLAPEIYVQEFPGQPHPCGPHAAQPRCSELNLTSQTAEAIADSIRLADAVELAGGKRPAVLPYGSIVYRDLSPKPPASVPQPYMVDREGVAATIQVAASLGAEGVILWGSGTDTDLCNDISGCVKPNCSRCGVVAGFLNGIGGEVISSCVAQRAACAKARCSGHGRCVDSSQLIEELCLEPGPSDVGSCRCDVGWRDVNCSTAAAFKTDDTAASSSRTKTDDDDEAETTWHGPQVKVISSGGRPMLSVGGAHEPPLWFVGHSDLSNTTARGQNETDNFYTQINASTHAGFNLVEILVDQWERAETSSGVSNKTTQSIDGILALNPSAMIILRPSVLPAVEPSVVMCKGNASSQSPSSLTTPASSQWLAKAKAGLLPFIKAVDAAYPGHIAGVHLTGMSTGEWMWPGAGSTGDLPNASATCDGNGAGQINGYSDYSEPMRTTFCTASNLSSGCALATPAERDLPRTGNSFVCGGSEAAAAAAAVVRQNMLLAQVMADAVGGLAQAVKEASGHKALVLTFFGYVLHCTTDRQGSNSRNLVNSGHLAGSSLLANKAIDGFVGTYSYSPNTRNVSMPLLPAGEYSSLWKKGKLWIIE